MTKEQIALEAARLALESQNASLLSDLIKVGIPSLVAIISGLFTYKISIQSANNSLESTKSSKEYEEKIALLNIKHESQKIISERKFNLLVEITTEMVEVCNAFKEYLDRLLTKKHLEKLNKEISQTDLDQIQKLYDDSCRTWNGKITNIYANAYLIGDSDFSANLKEFDAVALKIHNDCVYDCELSFEEYVRCKKEFDNCRDKIFHSLSLVMHEKCNYNS